MPHDRLSRRRQMRMPYYDQLFCQPITGACNTKRVSSDTRIKYLNQSNVRQRWNEAWWKCVDDNNIAIIIQLELILAKKLMNRFASCRRRVSHFRRRLLVWAVSCFFFFFSDEVKQEYEDFIAGGSRWLETRDWRLVYVVDQWLPKVSPDGPEGSRLSLRARMRRRTAHYPQCHPSG